MKRFSILLVLALAFGCSTVDSRFSADPERAAAVSALLESRNYTVYVTTMTSMRGMTNTLSHPWHIRVSGETLHSDLPYFGEAYGPVFPADQGLVFDGPLRDYTVKRGRRGETVIRFMSASMGDSYNYTLTVYPTGDATLVVSPDRKTDVIFEGRLNFSI